MAAVSVLVINSLIDILLFRLTGSVAKDSIYPGGLLSQIVEFSFVLLTHAASLVMVSLIYRLPV
jgi:CPA2 family monovalent cation:H+ antiporter-2